MLHIIDDFLEPEEFKKLSTTILSQKFPWFFVEHVSLNPKETSTINDPLAIETAGLNHSVFEKEWNVKSFSYEYLIPLFEKIKNEFGFTSEHLIRARISTKLQKPEFTSDNYNLPHVDYFFPHETMIYYLNDSDGDTRLFEEWSTYAGNNQAIGPDVFHTQCRITPKANRLVWFNGLQYHTASNPIKNISRTIINLNWNPL
jgi:hypothetical protein